ncbi:MAG: hypothetical protein GXC73_13000 [Chitinophagaceae bacterium]|nr:hypothetical protein [Chitinophagaceae bacterium]
MKVSFFFLTGLLFHYQSTAQVFAGAGIGFENLHLSSGRAIAPNLSLQYVADSRRVAYYFDAAGWRSSDVNETSFTDDFGNSSPVNEEYQYTHLAMQLGAKIYLTGDFDDNKVVLFTGGGFADYLTFNHYRTVSTSTQTAISGEKKFSSNAPAMHFIGGVSRHFPFLTAELNAGLNFIFKGVSELSGTSNVHTALRLKLLFSL